MEVDDRDLGPVEVDPVGVGPGDVGPHEVAEMRARPVEAAQEGVDGAGADGPPAPLVGPVDVDLDLDELDQIVERAHDLAVDVDRPVADGLGVAQLGDDVVHDHRVLLAVVLGVGEQERQQLLPAELLDGPEEGRDVALPGGDVGAGVGVVADGRGEERHGLERPRGQAEVGVAGRLVVAQVDVGVVEEQQVLALDVEDERLGVGRLGAEHARVEQAVEQEGGVGGLGGHARDAADVHVGAAGAVEELEVQVEGLVVTRQAGGQQLAHLREQQGLVALGPRGLAHLLARQRRNEDLGLEAGGEHLRGLADLGGQHAVGHEEHVAVEAGALVGGPHLRHDARDAQRLPVGQHPVDHDDVVELQVRALADPHPELERRGRLGADDPARDGGRGGLAGGTFHADRRYPAGVTARAMPPAGGRRDRGGPADAERRQPGRNERRTVRRRLSTFRSTRHTLCQVPSAMRPPSTGIDAYGGTSAGITCERPCPGDPCW